MRRVQRNLALYPNGSNYLDIRWQGRQVRRSLETANRREAKARLRVELAKLVGQNVEEAALPLGAKSVAVTRSEAKRQQLAAAGADHVVIAGIAV